MTWRRKSALGAAVILLLLVGYAGGRFAQPARIETKEVVKVQTQIIEKIVTKTEVQAATAVDAKKNVIIRRVWVTVPGGETRVTETTQDESTESTKTATATTTEGASTRAAATSIEAAKSSITTAQPAWSVGVQPGVKGLHLQLDVVGVTVEHRLFGGVWAGVWGNSAGMFGVGVRLDF